MLDTGNSREGRARDRSPGSLICPCRRESNKPHSFRAHSCRRQRRARLRTEDARSESPSSAPPKARADQSTSGGRPDSVRRRARRRGLRCHPNRSPARHLLGRRHRMQRLAVGEPLRAELVPEPVSRGWRNSYAVRRWNSAGQPWRSPESCSSQIWRMAASLTVGDLKSSRTSRNSMLTALAFSTAEITEIRKDGATKGPSRYRDCNEFVARA